MKIFKGIFSIFTVVILMILSGCPITITVSKPTIELLSPKNGEQNVDISTTLKWKLIQNIGDETITQLQYDVYVSEYKDDVKNLSEKAHIGYTSKTEFKLNNLKYGTKYYWRIVLNNENNEIKSDVWNFTTISKENALPIKVYVISYKDFLLSESSTPTTIIGNPDYMWLKLIVDTAVSTFTVFSSENLVPIKCELNSTEEGTSTFIYKCKGSSIFNIGDQKLKILAKIGDNEKTYFYQYKIKYPTISIISPVSGESIDPVDPDNVIFEWALPEEYDVDISKVNYQIGLNTEENISKYEEVKFYINGRNSHISKKLMGNTKYWWKIKALIPNEEEETEHVIYSPLKSFYTKNSVPYRPQILSPQNNTSFRYNVTFKFNIGDKDVYSNKNNGLTWQIWYRKDSEEQFSKLKEETVNFDGESTTIEFTKSFSEKGRYLWYIKIIDKNVWGEGENDVTSDTFAFTITGDAPPEKPELISPSKGETIYSSQPNQNEITITFQWKGKDPDNDELTYDIKIDGVLEKENHPSTEYTKTFILSDTENTQTHTWQVKAYDPYGLSSDWI